MTKRKLPLLSGESFDFDVVHVPQTITIQTNDICQLECVHCYLDQHMANKKARFTQPEELIEYLDGLNLTDVRAVYFVGAEVGLKPDLSNQLFKVVRDKFGKKIEIVTNAAYKPEVTEKLIDGLSPVDLTSIKISIDGIRAETHDRIRGKKGSFEQALVNTRLLLSKGFYVNPQMTSMPGNFVEIFDSMDFFRDLGVREVAYHTMSLEGKELFHTDHIDPVAWRSLVDKMISKDRITTDFRVKIPIIFYTEKELEDLIVGSGQKTREILSAIDQQEKGIMVDLPHRTCIADPQLNQYFFMDKDIPVSTACTIKSNTSRNYGGSTYLTWDSKDKKFVRSETDEMQTLYRSPYLCPSIFDAIKLRTNRVKSWLFKDAPSLYYSCRYPSYPNLPIADSQFNQYYEDSLRSYQHVDQQLTQLRLKHEKQFGK